jgi:hypothetical protein
VLSGVAVGGGAAAGATSAHFVLLIQVTVIGLVAPLVQPALDRGADAARDVRRHGRQLMLAGVVPAGDPRPIRPPRRGEGRVTGFESEL